FVQRRDLMRIEIVQPDANHRSFWVAFVDQPLHGVGEVDLCALLCHLYMLPASLRFHKEKEVARVVALVFVIIALRPPRLGRQRWPGILNELLGGLIKVGLGPSGIIRLSVDLQDIFHGGGHFHMNTTRPDRAPPRDRRAGARSSVGAPRGPYYRLRR